MIPICLGRLIDSKRYDISASEETKLDERGTQDEMGEDWNSRVQCVQARKVPSKLAVPRLHLQECCARSRRPGVLSGTTLNGNLGTV